MSNENLEVKQPEQKQKPLTEEELKQVKVLSINNILSSNKYIVIGESKIEVNGFTMPEVRAKLQYAAVSMENQVIAVMVNNAIMEIMNAAKEQAGEAVAENNK